jgi:hypothetical protein
MAALSNYLENKLIDQLFRGQPYTFPSTLYVGLFTSASSDTGDGAEVSGGSYARVPVSASLANWAGTQSAASTTESSGTSGTTSNNIAVTFPAPTANWGSISHVGIFDAATSGNLLIHGALTIPKTVNNGDSGPTFQASALSFQLDN